MQDSWCIPAKLNRQSRSISGRMRHNRATPSRVSGRNLSGMDDLTDDELVASAIADVMLDVLDRLADQPARRSDFLLDVLRLVATYGGGELAKAALREAGH